MKCTPFFTELSQRELAHSREEPHQRPNRTPPGNRRLSPPTALSRLSPLTTLNHRSRRFPIRRLNGERWVVSAHQAYYLLISMQADEAGTSELGVETLHKKRQRSPDSPEPSRPRKYHRQQEERIHNLLTRVTEAVEALCSSLQPPEPQSLQHRRTAAIKLMERDGGFKGPKSVPVIRLFISSMDVVDSYLAIRDKEIRTMYIKHYLALSRSP
jgi:hypothetical protein